ncbi:inositol hexakisphosphate and diphosphoinositol-pentakisphosphate kinase 2-like isoform X2 [Corticium candelabrum]|uniref:inositol hexakisphosphate and diphosphoinositol-pentakisphosphate kinase 2-like isoform X2 n=1 Tax=Corticium candelabrum TaxID=121492 RepID=UPI002E26B1D5|nr:inositol hexakisphosphate and diphosphoinositol-pentakisphosphate kinase 2-like isoform X2 [Corticium candelabrum]
MAESSKLDFKRSKVVVGVCAMKKKAASKPMKEILKRLRVQEVFEIVVFTDKQILQESVDNWPICDAFIAFYSTGFPLEKAIEYAELRKPYLVNDLPAQYLTRDRREVYRVLHENDIETPRYTIMNRDESSNSKLHEDDDWVEIDGTVFQKPFVEKPVDAEDHNVCIYYPTSAGGGSQKLFRKVGDKSSEYSCEGSVRKSGSYIYEDFMATDGTDVKVYTIGPHYAHAEARKCPALDGKVERDSEGKEIRYPVILTAREKQIARNVCLAFKQTVCGFDLLRANGKSYVCDVNGFSFVKTSKKYYDDCAQILGEMLLSNLAPHLVSPSSSLLIAQLVPQEEAVVPLPSTSGPQVELRCIVAIIRHGDRTPKQKLKMEVHHEKFYDFFEKHGGKRKGRLKLKKPSHLQEVLSIVRALLAEAEEENDDGMLCEDLSKLMQVKSVLEMYDSFSGINRKVQFRYLKTSSRPTSSQRSPTPVGGITDQARGEQGLLLILKWGGELTAAGGVQTQELGLAFRCMYPEETGEYGLGFLRLHSTYRHDLKIYAADEGRVQTTAAAFAKGLLALEGQLTPILVSLVNCDKTNNMLDSSTYAVNIMDGVKARLHDMLREDKEFNVEAIKELAPTGWISLKRSIEKMKNPFQACCQVHRLVQKVTRHVKQLMEELGPDIVLYHGETFLQMASRWEKLEKDFYQAKRRLFDISKVPDLYDCVKYDLLHNRPLNLDGAEELHDLVSTLADIVVPQEYGMTAEEKLEIAQLICSPLLRKMRADFKHNVPDAENFNQLNTTYCDDVQLMSSHGHVRTRLYFTSESHIHSVVNALRLGNLFNDVHDEQWENALQFLSSISEFNYTTQIVFRLYEDKSKPLESPHRFFVEILFSSGAFNYSEASKPGSRRPSQSIEFEQASCIASHPSFLSTADGEQKGSLDKQQEPLDELTPSPSSPSSLQSPTLLSREHSPSGSEDRLSVVMPTHFGQNLSLPSRMKLDSGNPGERRKLSVDAGQTPTIPENFEIKVKSQKTSVGLDPVFRRVNKEEERRVYSSFGLTPGLGMVSSIQRLVTLHSGVPLTLMDQFLSRTALDSKQMQEMANQSPRAVFRRGSCSP